jgi:methionyl-tRNA synthetase
VHVIGKGITRFHAIYWPAILLSAGEPLPTTILVHDYLTRDGRKLSKSLGDTVDPTFLTERYGADALRWWFVRDVPRKGDADFREELLAARANELADDLGNLVNRTIALVRRSGLEALAAGPPVDGAGGLQAAIDDALRAFDFRAATTSLWEVVAEANRFVAETRPWELAADDRLADVLATLLATCRLVAQELEPFLPAASARIATALDELDPQRGRALFRKFEAVA